MSERLREFVITGIFVSIIMIGSIFGAWVLMVAMS